MKKLFSVLVMMLVGVVVYGQIAAPNPDDGNLLSYLAGVLEYVGNLIANYWAIVVPVLWMIVRLTPTEKDNDILAKVIKWINWAVPNKKKDGGTH